MLSEDKITQFAHDLESLKAELSQSIALAESSSQPVPLDQSLQGRVSRGDALQQQQMAKAGLQRNRRRLVQVAQALERIDDGDYGYCLECGEVIAEGRLKIMPDAELCIRCKEKNESDP